MTTWLVMLGGVVGFGVLVRIVTRSVHREDGDE